MARIEDIEGVEVLEDEVAKSLGFVSVEAFQEWKRKSHCSLDEQHGWMLAEICNLRCRIAELEHSQKQTKVF